MNEDVLKLVRTLFEALQGGQHLAVGIAGTMLAVLAVRASAARLIAAPWPWLRAMARWVSSSGGGVALSAAVSLLGLLLPAVLRGPLTWSILGDAVMAWLGAMGAWSGLKSSSPRVKKWSAGRKARVTGVAPAALVLALCLAGTAAQAEEVIRANLLDSLAPPVAAQMSSSFAAPTTEPVPMPKPPSLADVFAPGLLVGVSWEPRTGQPVPHVGVVGSAALFKLFGRPLNLLAAMGAGASGVDLVPLLGLGASWGVRTGGPITSSLSVLATYSKGGWGMAAGFTFDFLLSGKPADPPPPASPPPSPPAASLSTS